jgi:hypothetical protein
MPLRPIGKQLPALTIAVNNLLSSTERWANGNYKTGLRTYNLVGSALASIGEHWLSVNNKAFIIHYIH